MKVWFRFECLGDFFRLLVHLSKNTVTLSPINQYNVK